MKNLALIYDMRLRQKSEDVVRKPCYCEVVDLQREYFPGTLE